jgi:hypothetical protein
MAENLPIVSTASEVRVHAGFFQKETNTSCNLTSFFFGIMMLKTVAKRKMNVEFVIHYLLVATLKFRIHT